MLCSVSSFLEPAGNDGIDGKGTGLLAVEVP